MLFISIIFLPIIQCSIEIDSSVEVKTVIDGVTFLSTTNNFFKLADVVPRCTDWDNSTGFITSKSFLTSIIGGKTVYLDIDSQYVTDEFGTGNKIICIAYIDYNSSHLLNVNQAIVEHGLLLIDDLDNDFNPESWTRFIKKQSVPEFPSLIILSIFFLTTIILTLYRIKLKD